MILSPQYILDNKILTYPDSVPITDDMVSPNGIELTLDTCSVVNKHDITFFGSTTKRFASRTDLKARKFEKNELGIPDGNHFIIPANSSICCDTLAYVTLPEDVCAQIIIRSTLSRNNHVLSSGVYDSGYCGHVGFAIYNLNAMPSYIEKGSRVAQIIFHRAESAKSYAGGYNTALGESWHASTTGRKFSVNVMKI